jgi:hypothetical protein
VIDGMIEEALIKERRKKAENYFKKYKQKTKENDQN